MLNEETINGIYDKVIEENKEEIERERKEAIKERIVNWLMAIITLIVEYIILTLPIVTRTLENIWQRISIMNGMIGLMVILTLIPISYLILLGPAFFWINRTPKKNTYLYNFKNRLIKEIIKIYNQDLEYLPNEKISISMEQYRESKFRKFEQYEASNLIKGKLNNNCTFEIIQIIGNFMESYNRIPLFYGLLTKVEGTKKINSTIYLRKREGAIKPKKKFGEKRVEIDSRVFENKFDVYASDEDATRTILNHEVIEMMVDFNNELNIDYEVTIKNNCIYIMFDIQQKIFKNSLYKEVPLKKERLYIYYRILDFTMDITNKLMNSIESIEKEI